MEKENKYGVKVGDVFHSTHGYNMTIQDFWKVTKILGTQKIEVRRLDTYNTYSDHGQVGYLKMNYNKFNNLYKDYDNIREKMVKLSYNTPMIKISDWENAYLLPVEDYDKEYYFNYLD